MTYKAKADYQRCVELVTEAALREMQFPALICVATPIFVGLVFRFIGEGSDRALLGAEVLASYLMFATVTGILMYVKRARAGNDFREFADIFFETCAFESGHSSLIQRVALGIMPRNILKLATTAGRILRPTKHPSLGTLWETLAKTLRGLRST